MTYDPTILTMLLKLCDHITCKHATLTMLLTLQLYDVAAGFTGGHVSNCRRPTCAEAAPHGHQGHVEAGHDL
jgi:hypothetical protein